jgi:hypothetical protein
MGRIKLPHVNSFRNRHGTMVFYFRKRGCKIVRLRGLPGSPEFMRAYEAALGNAEPIVIGASRAKAGTVAATVGMMLASVAFGGGQVGNNVEQECRDHREHNVYGWFLCGNATRLWTTPDPIFGY